MSPRISASFRINRVLTLETSVGKYHQFLHQFNSPQSTRGAQNTWLLSTSLIPPVSSFNTHIGIYWQSGFYNLNLAFYSKQAEDLYDFQDFLSPVSPAFLYHDRIQNLSAEPIGNGETRGAEVFARKKSGKITGWVSYQWNKTEYTFPILNGGKSFPADHDITHEFKTVVLTSLGKWNLAANWVYSSGRVYTNPNEIIISNNYQILINSGMRNNNRLQPVHHLDISLSRQWQINSLILDTGISVYNLYNQDNISHKRYNPYTTTGSIISDVAMLGITPTFFLQASIQVTLWRRGESNSRPKQSDTKRLHTQSSDLYLTLFSIGDLNKQGQPADSYPETAGAFGTSLCDRRSQIKPQAHLTRNGLLQLSSSHIAVIGIYWCVR